MMTTIQNICKAAKNRNYNVTTERHGKNGIILHLVRKDSDWRKNRRIIKIELEGMFRTLCFSFTQKAVRPDGLYAMPFAGDYRLNNFDGQYLKEQEIIDFINAN